MYLKTEKIARTHENITFCSTISSGFAKPQEHTDRKLTLIITSQRKVIIRYLNDSKVFGSEDLKAQGNGRSRTSLSTPFNDRLPFVLADLDPSRFGPPVQIRGFGPPNRTE